MYNQSLSPTADVALTSRFFFLYSCALLVIVLVGFAPTLFLRFLTDPPPIPFYLHLHGAVVTMWFVTLVLQASLVGRANQDLHRRLGWWGAAYGLFVVCAGLMATLGAVPRALAGGITFDTDIADVGVVGLGEGVPFFTFISSVVWINLTTVVGFAILLSAAVLLRKQPAFHKRYMLLATLGLMGPALARIARWPGLGTEQGPFIPLAMLTLIITLVVYDLRTMRKVHKATWSGIVVNLVAFAAGPAIASTAAGQAFVRSLQ